MDLLGRDERVGGALRRASGERVALVVVAADLGLGLDAVVRLLGDVVGLEVGDGDPPAHVAEVQPEAA